jgi:deazaflavin-dependent oxidoreductase (nitroreductase family)
MSEQVTDSPTDWVNEHIQRYLASDGQDGHEWQPGVRTLLLTTRGRKSGRPRRTALIYGQDGDRYVIVASQGGAPAHPAWYLNLQANPEADLQVGADRFTATAETAEGEERARLWDMMAEIWPAYNDYATRTDREIPLVVLTRT